MSANAPEHSHRDSTSRQGIRVGQWLALSIGVLLAFAIAGIGLALLANARLGEQRELLLNHVGPALRTSLELENALVNEETGVRGYALTAEPRFLEPYHSGLAAQEKAFTSMRTYETSATSQLPADLAAVRARAEAWRSSYVLPILAQPRRPNATALDTRGKQLFDAIRRALERLHANLTRRDNEVRRQFFHEAKVLELVLILAGALILGSVAGAGFMLRRIITRPLERLGGEARRVAGGEFDSPLAAPGGAREITLLAGELDGMRERIVHELAQVSSARGALEAQALELTRSNAELEQFAYVASHDLQEPLRKVASFCQALEQRYKGQLDERADQYIDFAVDGAKRMQILINDLLAFSRVGRSGHRHELLQLDEIVAAAQSSLGQTLRDTGATIEVGELPVVLGERVLLVSLFQNLIANALKFHGDEPPYLRIAAERRGEEWEICCTDNGIGIEPEYAERIFVIFQRLHTREAFEGTGIGLAMCRKIVEYHGGHIWLDTTHAPGACFRFTLPVAKGVGT